MISHRFIRAIPLTMALLVTNATLFHISTTLLTPFAAFIGAPLLLLAAVGVSWWLQCRLDAVLARSRQSQRLQRPVQVQARCEETPLEAPMTANRSHTPSSLLASVSSAVSSGCNTGICPNCGRASIWASSTSPVDFLNTTE